MSDGVPKNCSHGKPLMAMPPVPCVECEIVWYRDCLNDALRRVASCTDKIVELSRSLSKSHDLPKG